ncbi:hypothetical protein B0H13DRAFT_2301163 [Mycena leptocephala]|nr:hypothetical protein B0H13DRAFT_2301163 [Mycena leptocephala]
MGAPKYDGHTLTKKDASTRRERWVRRKRWAHTKDEEGGHTPQTRACAGRRARPKSEGRGHTPRTRMCARRRDTDDQNINDNNADHPNARGAPVMKHNVPEYSGIPNDTPPEKVAPEFVKVCWRHAKEPVNDFRSLVSPPDFRRLQDFVYIYSKETLNEFSAFIDRLGETKIQNWWRHKKMHEWIIPCLVKSQSPIPADVWDRTPSMTNTNEAQHAWTNARTGIRNSL